MKFTEGRVPRGKHERTPQNDALNCEQMKQLQENQWEIYEKTYTDIFSTLVALESALIGQLKVKARLKTLKDAKEANKQTTSGKRNIDDTSKQKTVFWSTLSGKKEECKTCGKKNAGKCWHLNTGANERGPRFQKDSGFQQKQFNTMKKLTAMSQRTIDTESDSNNDSTTQYNWAKGISHVHQMYIAQEYRRKNAMVSNHSH